MTRLEPVRSTDKVRITALLACLVALAAGCGAPSRVHYEERVGEASGAAVHGVHSERLSELMRGLARLQAERLPQAMDVEIEERRRSAEIADVARSMARAGEEIPAAALEAGLDDDARAEFQLLADALVRGANRLAVLADAPEVGVTRLDGLRAASREIEVICDRCHSQFRIPRAGPE
jgi:cytochrome c556